MAEEMIVHEGVTMQGYRPTHWGSYMPARTTSGNVIETRRWGKTGDRSFEPSGHWFDVYGWLSEFVFHPFSGAIPIPCGEPVQYICYPKK